MRVGFNPYKDVSLNKTDYIHQVIIPVYIPNQEGYFKDSFTILKLCLASVFATVHSKTFVSIVNNGSCSIVVTYLNELFEKKNIHELIHTENIGKLNAILKGLSGNNIDLVTISDADVLFLDNWQMETVKVFKEVPRAGVVGIVPQFKMYENNCGNVLFDTLFNSKLRFIPVKNKAALIQFYDSLGWDRNYNQDYLAYNLALEVNNELNVLIGSGHFVATYKKNVFDTVVTYIGYKMGGNSEGYLDTLPLEKDYWRVTTEDNYAYHMGNTFENWMEALVVLKTKQEEIHYNFENKNKVRPIVYWMKNRLFVKFISSKFLMKLYLKRKKLPKALIKRY